MRDLALHVVSVLAQTISTVYIVDAIIFTMTTAQSALCVCQEMPGLNNGLALHVFFLRTEKGSNAETDLT